mmetsp:Transcript_48878/g.118336  ORF Transcript_48878/g.118336 Transcript_48878/m.118336 type:complete len:601 (-) Transcript_48878:52-1854(-)
MEDEQISRGCVVPVVYVDKRNAKCLKKALEDVGSIDRRFRMCPAESSSSSSSSSWIAIPVLEKEKNSSLVDESLESMKLPKEMIEGRGKQYCPYSTAMLGNNQCSRYNNIGINNLNNPDSSGSTTVPTTNFSVAQSILFELVTEKRRLQQSMDGDDHHHRHSNNDVEEEKRFKSLLCRKICQLDTSTVCPSKIEVMGDDRTLVIPSTAFTIDYVTGEDDSFRRILMLASFKSSPPSTMGESSNEDDDEDDYHQSQPDSSSSHIFKLQDEFYERLAKSYRSRRIVSRGRVSKDSKVRESGHRLIWPRSTETSSDGIPSSTGPDIPESWICVTEQGIRQSFDLTRVMFSRGNISEKIRFGKELVQPNDVVLDMYAGIGYYTLPAVLKGQAQKVYACEWNPYAAQALRFNVKDNNVEDKVDVFVGDCRTSIQQNNIVDKVDRVSLGLLPSSEGGWKSAVSALKHDAGGWLHVHGNVPNKERDTWSVWLCSRLFSYVQERQTVTAAMASPDWVVICVHVERVKSFAPTVSHYVADVFVGLPDRLVEFLVQNNLGVVSEHLKDISYGVLQRDPESNEISFMTSANPDMPSCALSKHGAISEEWMR